MLLIAETDSSDPQNTGGNNYMCLMLSPGMIEAILERMEKFTEFREALSSTERVLLQDIRYNFWDFECLPFDEEWAVNSNDELITENGEEPISGWYLIDSDKVAAMEDVEDPDHELDYKNMIVDTYQVKLEGFLADTDIRITAPPLRKKELEKLLQDIRAKQDTKVETEEHDPETCGCDYLGSNVWSCGHVDGERE